MIGINSEHVPILPFSGDRRPTPRGVFHLSIALDRPSYLALANRDVFICFIQVLGLRLQFVMCALRQVAIFMDFLLIHMFVCHSALAFWFLHNVFNNYLFI